MPRHCLLPRLALPKMARGLNDGCCAEVRKAPEIPASPHQQTKTTPLKRSASSGVACTLMPFSLIKVNAV